MYIVSGRQVHVHADTYNTMLFNVEGNCLLISTPLMINKRCFVQIHVHVCLSKHFLLSNFLCICYVEWYDPRIKGRHCLLLLIHTVSIYKPDTKEGGSYIQTLEKQLIKNVIHLQNTMDTCSYSTVYMYMCIYIYYM